MTLLSGAHAQLPEPVAQALRQAGIPDSHVGVLVRELDGATLLAHGEDRALNPASVMKLVTTLAALDALGPAHTFKTLVWLDGPLRDGVLDGNLVLRGGGDPGMTRERFWSLLRELRQRGIRQIRGDVILDNGHYAFEAADPGAFDQAPLRPYNAQPAALLVNFNTTSLRLCASGGEVSARLDPPLETVHLENRLRPSEEACEGWGERLSPRLEGGGLVLDGDYPAPCGERVLALNLGTPAVNAAAWFNTLWRELGGELAGRVREGRASAEAGLLLAFDSPPLSQLARDVNKHSNNVMAKMLFLNLGVARYGAPATWEKGERAVRAWLRERGLVLPKLVLENGAGLSRIERLSAAALAELLGWAARQPAYYEFAASLPAVGLEGTQKNRFRNNGENGVELSGKAWLKTGSLNGARNLAGYVLGADGQRRVFVFLINHPNAGAAARAQQALLAWAVAYTKMVRTGGVEQ